MLANANADENFLKNWIGSSQLVSIPILKTTMKRHNFQDIEDIKENKMRQLHALKQNAFQGAFQKWKKRWKHAVGSGGDYLEGTVCENDVS